MYIVFTVVSTALFILLNYLSSSTGSSLLSKVSLVFFPLILFGIFLLWWNVTRESHGGIWNWFRYRMELSMERAKIIEEKREQYREIARESYAQEMGRKQAQHRFREGQREKRRMEREHEAIVRNSQNLLFGSNSRKRSRKRIAGFNQLVMDL